MKKLTAGIFAGILTIVTVNAADAAIATSGYVTEKVSAVDAKVGTLDDLTTTAKGDTVAAINEVAGKVATNTTNIATNTSNISSLKTTVDGLTTGDNSVAKQIADKLGEGFPANSTVKAELDKKANQTALDETNAKVAANESAISAANGKITANENAISAANGKITANENAIDNITKVGGTIDQKIETAQTTLNTAIDKKQDKSTADYAMGTAAGGWKALTADELGALQSGIKAADVTQITTNKTDIAGINTKIGEVAADKTVVGLINEAKEAAGSNLSDKLGNLGEGNNTVADALADKQNLLNDTNVSTTGDGNVISEVVAEKGVVTAKKGIKAVTVPVNPAPSEEGDYVLTATVAGDGTPTYYWESIDRTPQPK